MKLRAKYERNTFNIDWVLVAILIILMITSFIAIYLAMPLVKNLPGLLGKQIVWYTIGFILLAGLVYLGKENIFTLIYISYGLLIFALILLMLDRWISIPFVSPINGSRAWFIFPGFGNFQPSEFMKVVLIIITAKTISDHNSNKTEDSFTSDISLFGKVLLWVAPPLVLIIIQPDTGIPLIIIISILAMVAVSGIKRAWIYGGAFIITSVVVGFLFIFYNNQELLTTIFGSSYRLGRFYGWLETEKYITSYGDQLYKGLLAIGSAGLSGHPFGQILVWFAEPQNDFIFAVIGQNFGFIGTAFVLILSAVLDLKLLSIAINSNNMQDRLITVGVLGMLIFQQVENMGMIAGLLPITGVTLPFISYGGSSLWSYMIPLSIIFIMSSEIMAKKR